MRAKLTRSVFCRDCEARPDLVSPDAPSGTEVYTADAKMHYVLVAFRGKAVKPDINAWYLSADARRTVALKWMEGLVVRQVEKQARQMARKGAACPFKEGDLLEGSWGYDQTNVEFWRIVAVRGRKVIIREVSHVTVPGSEGFMCATVVPGEIFGPEQVHIAQTHNGREWYVRLHESCSLRLSDGGPCCKSWYA